MLANLLLPAPDALRLQQVIADDALVTLVVETTAVDAACPDCQLPSTAVHSRYSRKLNDLACGLRRVRLHLLVRRFFCRNTACQRRTFAERIPQIAQPWARRTSR